MIIRKYRVESSKKLHPFYHKHITHIPSSHTYTFYQDPSFTIACVMECKSVLQVKLIHKNKCKNVFKTKDEQKALSLL